MDLNKWLSLIPILLITVGHAAAEPRCALVPYGRPKSPDCIFISNHVIPQRSNPEPFVLFKGKHSFIRFPLIFYFRQYLQVPFQLSCSDFRKGSCIVNITPSHMPAIDPQHVWWASMDELRDHLDQIIDMCLVHGDSGWPPMQGGVSRFEHGLGAFLPLLPDLLGFHARMLIACRQARWTYRGADVWQS